MEKPLQEKLEDRRKKQKIYNDANREHVRKRAREYKKNNPAQIAESKRKDYEKNKEKYRARSKKYNENNKDTVVKRRKEHYAKNRESMIAYTKKFREEHPEYMVKFRESHRKNNRQSLIWSSVKKWARVKNVEFDLTQEWIKERLDSGVCEMSGIAFDLEGKRTPNSPSVDRINPTGPYTKGNCRIILWSINRALSNYGEDYILSVFGAIIKRKETI